MHSKWRKSYRPYTFAANTDFSFTSHLPFTESLTIDLCSNMKDWGLFVLIAEKAWILQTITVILFSLEWRMILSFTTLQQTSSAKASWACPTENTHTSGNMRRTVATTVTCPLSYTQLIYKLMRNGTHTNKLLIVTMVTVRTFTICVLGCVQNIVRVLVHILLNSFHGSMTESSVHSTLQTVLRNLCLCLETPWSHKHYVISLNRY